MNWKRTIVILFLFFATCNALSLPFVRFGHLNNNQFDSSLARELSDSPKIETQFFDQQIDHYNLANNATFKQRFWHNDRFAKANGPQFLRLGGEGTAGANMVTVPSAFNYWGQNVSAGLWALEHRFYGNSRPFESQTTENLQFLTSRQALEDVAQFIQAQNVKLNLTNPKWIVFGCSYAGSLALWMRELYPDLVVGAVGGSAPVYAKLDFYDYLQVCEDAYNVYNNCTNNIKNAFDVLGAYMTSKAKRDVLSHFFKLSPAFNETELTETHIQFFYLDVLFGFMHPVQYNYKNAVSTVCNIMKTPTHNPIKNIVRVLKMNDYVPSIDYQDAVNNLRNPTYTNNSFAIMRSWTWQTCNEFGFIGTTDAGGSIFGSRVPLNLGINFCMDIFGSHYNIDHLKRVVANTNKQYGGRDNYRGTNVVAANGALDPWHALGLLNATDPSVVTYLIEGASHCNDVFAPKENDKASIKKLHQITFENIQKWLGLTKNKVAQSVPKHEIIAEPEKPAASFTLFQNVLDKESIAQHSKQRTPGASRFSRFRNSLRKNPLEFSDAPTIKYSWIEQKLDHFDDANNETWQQRYFHYETFYKPGGPVFLKISGESGIRSDMKSLLSQLTKKYNADVYVLEHRFYGKSQPFADLSTANLKFLSSRQALRDIAHFIKTINGQAKYENPKWITFGCSYSGSLSAWFREFYPDLTVGAVASSAALLHKVDVFEYVQTTEKSLRAYSQPCADSFAVAFADVNQKLNTIAGRKQINKILKPSKPLDEFSPNIKDVQTFMDNLNRGFTASIQNQGSSSSYGMAFFCKIMLNSSNSPITNLRIAYETDYLDARIDSSYEELVTVLSDKSFDTIDADWRSWIWQECTEFGFFHSTDFGRNIFGSSVPVDYFIDLCTDVFGPEINRYSIDAAVASTEKYYGGITNYNATNVVLTNGSLDPWRDLGLYNTSDPSVVSILINGSEHCSDTGIHEDEVPGLAEARRRIGELVGQWIQ